MQHVLRLDGGIHMAALLPAVPVNRERINEIEALGVLGQYRSEHAWNNVSLFWMPWVDFP